MRIVVFGAGAIGALFGAYLSGNHNATLICREIYARAINENGLRITGLSDFVARPRAVSSTEGVEPPELLIFTVKAYDTAGAAEDAANLVGNSTKILSLQNGLGNLEVLAKAFPDTEIIGGVTSQGAILQKPGVIEHTGKSYTFIGDETVASLLTDSGIDSVFTPGIQSEIWYKAIVNSVINPIGTLMGDRNGLLVRDNSFLPLARRIVKEGVEVANSKGNNLIFEKAWEKTIQVATETSENICSMRKDVEAGKRTEIEQMNGAIARFGMDAGIHTPANSLMTALIKSLHNA